MPLIMALSTTRRTLLGAIRNNAERMLQNNSQRQISSINGREEAVVVTDDGSTIVCWHPEPKVPYHLTKPNEKWMELGVTWWATARLSQGKQAVTCHVIPSSSHFLYGWNPLPIETKESDSVLKVQNSEQLKKLFSQQHPFFVSKELREITYTTKHPWFPKPGKRYAKKQPPRDREYL